MKRMKCIFFLLFISCSVAKAKELINYYNDNNGLAVFVGVNVREDLIGSYDRITKNLDNEKDFARYKSMVQGSSYTFIEYNVQDMNQNVSDYLKKRVSLHNKYKIPYSISFSKKIIDKSANEFNYINLKTINNKNNIDTFINVIVSKVGCNLVSSKINLNLSQQKEIPWKFVLKEGWYSKSNFNILLNLISGLNQKNASYVIIFK